MAWVVRQVGRFSCGCREGVNEVGGIQLPPIMPPMRCANCDTAPSRLLLLNLTCSRLTLCASIDCMILCGHTCPIILSHCAQADAVSCRADVATLHSVFCVLCPVSCTLCPLASHLTPAQPLHPTQHFLTPLPTEDSHAPALIVVDADAVYHALQMWLLYYWTPC